MPKILFSPHKDCYYYKNKSSLKRDNGKINLIRSSSRSLIRLKTFSVNLIKKTSTLGASRGGVREEYKNRKRQKICSLFFLNVVFQHSHNFCNPPPFFSFFSSFFFLTFSCKNNSPKMRKLGSPIKIIFTK